MKTEFSLDWQFRSELLRAIVLQGI
ncbi:hypothetical protein F383_05190 [Gossypium arboreum]|uniref:Uncharacterized protein n=1 Tax=Gossypium arboreum TaxID=29729 RepID=A0A0B0M8T6_GOSAR|nr:hypothetical protein F383_37846 [Gossypium arboreum]KHG23549.1 hypothetical protein F383_05190 [Gossypium arboreum]